MPTNSFVALGVAGDAFLYHRASRFVLVDGGGSGVVLARELRKHAPGIGSLDVVVCTHADSDHAGGLTTFLNHWRWIPPGQKKRHLARVREFWLPGRWTQILDNFLRDPVIFVDSLVQELREAAHQHEDWKDKDPDIVEEKIATEVNDLVRKIRQKNQTQQAQKQQVQNKNLSTSADHPWDDQDWLADDWDNSTWKQERLEAANERRKGTRALNDGRRTIERLSYNLEVGPRLAGYWLNLIDTLDTIRLIAHHARRHRSRIRWFDFDAFESGTDAFGSVNDHLMPVNAVEQQSLPMLLMRYQYIHLSRKNEASLVFYAPETNADLGVLFCGDSPLGTRYNYSIQFKLPLPPPKKMILATAPHHGAASNDMAYYYVNGWASNVIWVRSGGKPSHPDGYFRKILASTQRACTNCPHKRAGSPHQAVNFSQTSASTAWTRSPPTVVCDCCRVL